MPKKTKLNSPIQQAVYNYLAENGITYDEGKETFGFGTRQAFHAWVHREHKRQPELEGKIKDKLIELGAYEPDELDELDDLE